ncbi:pentapeptide repeat-containing protein [Streptomyces sp. P5-A9]|uniref:pentapeptide repeat-containing protein n=1 Tax=Streptomyces sp. P5-A9 TaxID=3071730 RepID=UPI002FC9710F
MTFTERAQFDDVAFSGDTQFFGTTFTGRARYSGATFARDAQFDEATFTSDALFGGAAFNGDAQFDRVAFHGNVEASGATFTGDAQFNEAVVAGSGTLFREATFHRGVRLRRAEFDKISNLGPLVCGARVTLDGALFQQPVTVEIAAAELSCVRTRWASTAVLHLRHTEVDLRNAVFELPVTIAAHASPFPSTRRGGDLIETVLSGRAPGVRLVSLGWVDAAHLELQDIDLSLCRIVGAVHLDQLKVDGWCTFATSPAGWSRRYPWRWTRRRTLAEESHWRVRSAHRPELARGWTVPSLPRKHQSWSRPQWRCCTGSCASRWRTGRTSQTRPTSTTASARCAAMTRPGPRGTVAASRVLGHLGIRPARHPRTRLAGRGHGCHSRGAHAVGATERGTKAGGHRDGARRGRKGHL